MKSIYRELVETHRRIVRDSESEIQDMHAGRRNHGNSAGPSNAPAVERTRMKWSVHVTDTIIHDSPVCTVAYSADGLLLASGTKNSTRLSNALTGDKISDLPIGSEEEGFVRTACFSHDGKSLATAGEANFVQVWDVIGRNLRRRLHGHQDDIYSIDISLCSSLILSGSGDHNIKVWNLSSGAPRQSMVLDDVVTSVKFSPVNSTAVCGSLDSKARVWNFERNQVVRTMAAHSNSIYSTAFSPDGGLIVTGSLDNTLMLWDLTADTLSPAMTFKGHKSFVLSVTFFNSGINILSGSRDNSVGIWDVRNSSQPVIVHEHDNSVISVARNPVIKTFATGSGDKLVKIWNYDLTN